MIKIKLLEDDVLRDRIEYLHWKWFLKRLTKKCSWDPYKTYTYYQYIKTHIKYATKTEMIGLSAWDIDKLFQRRLKELVIGPDDVTKKGLQNFLEQKNRYGKMNFWDKDKVEKLQKAFGYADFRSPPETSKWYKEFKEEEKCQWSKEELLEKLKIEVCPYCNREYIFTTEKKHGKKRLLAEIDHFYPQKIYPYLSCYLYNFIPACLPCNHGKGEKLREIIYPYEEEFGRNGKFELKINDEGDVSFPIDFNDVCVKLKIKGKKQIRKKNKKI